MRKLILASNSPRRKELLQYLDIPFEIRSENTEEIVDYSIPSEELVMDLAFQKAAAVFRKNQESIVMGFDTLVYVDDVLLGKPKTKEDAYGMLRQLSGKTHFVLTGCAVISKEMSKSFYEKTRVSFHEMTEQEILDYVETGEPMDKAGAYGIQGKGAKFVKHVNGDYFTVMGMPLSRLYHELKDMNLLGEIQ